MRRARYCLLHADPEARRKPLDEDKVIPACIRVLRGRAAPPRIDAAWAFALAWAVEEQEAGAPPSLAEGFEMWRAQLARLDRYERRALSRRRKCVDPCFRSTWLSLIALSAFFELLLARSRARREMANYLFKNARVVFDGQDAGRRISIFL